MIIVDTNALIAIGEFKMDVFEEIKKVDSSQIQILSGTIVELNKIKNEQRGKFKSAASLALSILKAKEIKIQKSEGDVDDALVKLSMKGHLVLTQDKELKKRLQKPYMTIRQKKKVVIV
mgnify:FL=1